VYFRLAALKTEAGRGKHIRDYIAKLERGEIGEPGVSAPALSQSGRKSCKRVSAQADGNAAHEGMTQPLAAKITRSGRQVRPRSS
jgi:hypothetical protein